MTIANIRENAAADNSLGPKRPTTRMETVCMEFCNTYDRMTAMKSVRIGVRQRILGRTRHRVHQQGEEEGAKRAMRGCLRSVDGRFGKCRVSTQRRCKVLHRRLTL